MNILLRTSHCPARAVDGKTRLPGLMGCNEAGAPPVSLVRRVVMDDRKLLGKRIKSLRRSKGHTQEGLAEIIDISANYLAVIERGEANPTLTLLERLSAGLEVPLSELFQYHPEEGYQPAQLRRKLDQMVNEAREGELPRLTRVFESLLE